VTGEVREAPNKRCEAFLKSADRAFLARPSFPRLRAASVTLERDEGRSLEVSEVWRGSRNGVERSRREATPEFLASRAFPFLGPQAGR